MTKEEELIRVAMEIILKAGDARSQSDRAVELAKEGNFVQVAVTFKEAKKNITGAHQAQTKVIQDEARGVEYPLSLLFIHAQDTLMTIASEIRITKAMIDLYELSIKKE